MQHHLADNDVHPFHDDGPFVLVPPVLINTNIATSMVSSLPDPTSHSNSSLPQQHKPLTKAPSTLQSNHHLTVNWNSSEHYFVLQGHQDHVNDYRLHPFFLSYVKPETEERYLNYVCVTTGYHGGLFWQFATVLFAFGLTANYRKVDETMFIDPIWAAFTNGTVFCLLAGFLLFMKNAQVREMVTTLSIVIMFPGYGLALLHGRQTQENGYPLITACAFYCIGVSQLRFARCVFAVTVPYLVMIVLSCFLIDSYWDNRSKWEILWWLFPLFPLGIARIWERRLRASFQRIDVAQMELRSIQENVTVMHNTVASFFPSTPTMRMIVLPPAPVQESVFPRTVLIVTDLVGFTSWTTRTSLRDVVDTLSNMFTEMHEVAQHLHVEKISTVGDSFVGVIFETSGDMMDTSGERCILGIQFGVSVLELGGALKMRVGVHIGDVVGGFVGFSPPQFDIFSPHLDRAKALESTGSPSRIHVSHEVLQIAKAYGGTPLDPHITVHGVLIAGWNAVGLPDLTSRLHYDPINVHAAKICGALMDRRSTNEITSPRNMKQTDFSFSLPRLQFLDPDVERGYIAWLRKSKLHMSALYVLIGMEISVWCTHVILGCTDTIQDKLVIVLILVTIVLYFFYLQYQAKAGWTPLVTAVMFGIPTFLSTFSTSSCSGLPVESRLIYTGNIHFFYHTVHGVASQYNLDVPLLRRLLYLAAITAAGISYVYIHQALVGDNAIPFDVTYFVMMAAYSAITLMIDGCLRQGYQAQLRVEDAIGQTGSYAKFLRQSMDLMVPEFVTTKILEYRSGAMEKMMSSSNSDNSILWEYPNIGAMFVSFHPTMKPDGEPHTIDVRTILESLERVALDNKLIKVKSVGTSMLCVCGLTTNPRDTSMQENALALCTAAQQMVRALEHCPNVTYKVGLHSGPCFGVVLGSAAVTFDVFGDTINTASRMHTSAPSNTVQLSAVVMECMEDAEFPDAIFTPLTAMVEIRGKGYMHVYSMKDAVRTPNLKVDNDYEFII